MSDTYYLMYVLVFFVAFLYSSVGHGGASGYIAVMALFGLAPPEIRTNALMMNIVVAGIAFFQFIQNRKLDTTLTVPLFVSSIPLAYFGGSIQVSEPIFKYLLAFILILPVIRFSGIWTKDSQKSAQPQIWMLILSGGLIGLLSGILGIGGGIILTPLLLWFGWTDSKQAALISALFIVVNSAAGLLGVFDNTFAVPDSFLALLLTAVLGGILGSYKGAQKYSNDGLKKVLAGVLFIAILKLVVI